MTNNNRGAATAAGKDKKFRLINKEVNEIFNGVFAARNKIYDERNADVAVECLGVRIHVIAYLLEHATWNAKQTFGFNDDMINEIIRAARYGLTLEHLKGERKANLEFEIELEKRRKKPNNKVVNALTEELAELERKGGEKGGGEE